jgi:hypothetical protein
MNYGIKSLFLCKMIPGVVAHFRALLILRRSD